MHEVPVSEVVSTFAGDDLVDDPLFNIVPPATLPPSPSPPPPPQESRCGRTIRPTWKVRELVPSDDAEMIVEDMVEEREEVPVTQNGVRRVVLLVTERIYSSFNQFNMRRLYKRKPHQPPNLSVDLESRYTPMANQEAAKKSRRTFASILAPFPNLSSFLFAWHHQRSHTKSLKDRDALQDMLCRPDFSAADIANVNFVKLDEELAHGGIASDHPFLESCDGWKESTITIGIPSGRKPTQASKRDDATAARRLERHQHVPDVPAPHAIPGFHYTVRGFWHKGLCAEIIHTLSSDPAARDFVFDPYYVERKVPGTETTERVYGEVYNSEVFVQEDIRLQNSPPEPGCDLPRVIVPLMFWSDATQVAQFGQAKVWPLYLYYGNQSKYDRARPTAQAGHHVAYFVSLPDDARDSIREYTGKGATAQLLAHCRRELFHGQWNTLLDAEFMYAYKHGIVITCVDGVRRRVYPRIFSYSADYPEKVLIATIRDKGHCPCPRCEVTFDDIPQMGEDADRDIRNMQARTRSNSLQEKVLDARNLVYEEGFVVNSKRVEELLQNKSLVPTKNAFDKLQPLGFNLGDALVVDLMHEYELGVWKSMFTHLIRILEAVDSQAVDELDKRFRQVPTFGRSTIRKFAHNVSEMKRMAARDFEAILKCIIPCIDGLTPAPHNDNILTLLYHMAYWHALAKMRLHTDTSVRLLDNSTTILGRALRNFAAVTCAAFDTKETQSEYAARQRAQARNMRRGGHTSQPQTVSTGRRHRTLNLRTVKWHFLGDYVRFIKRKGTTDSYTTQIGEHEHRRVKARRKRTNYVNADAQVVNMDVREAQMRRIAHELQECGIDVPGVMASSSEAAGDGEVVLIPPSEHDHIAKDQSDPVLLATWARSFTDDVALQGFISHMREHLALRLRTDHGSRGQHATANNIIISQDRIFRHATMQVNFTTYDLQRDQDIIHVGTPKTGIMMHAPAFDGSDSDIEGLPWTYAVVLGIYHANIVIHDNGVVHAHRINFLWTEDGQELLASLIPLQFFVVATLFPPSREGVHSLFYHHQWLVMPMTLAIDRDMFVRHIGCGLGHIVGLVSPYVETLEPSDYVFAPAPGGETSQEDTTAHEGEEEQDHDNPSYGMDQGGGIINEEDSEEYEGEEMSIIDVNDMYADY
ncbi:hypothetical protein BD309DRAFT_1083909 [Dichomitus squalens]|nr:hypothetical protein BD309DRAFT_1083909 [Dichomitus squalens]